MAKKERATGPPQWARRLLQWYCRPELLEDLEGDLNEYFSRNAATRGRSRARLIYIADVFKFFRPYTVKKPSIASTMISFIVLQNYFKTSLRNIAKNRLFSFLNIAGLAISMAVGLLIIAIVTELRTYDSFHAHRDRIYRVENILRGSEKTPHNYATTSVAAARQVRETVPGLEAGSIVRRGFNNDIKNGDKVLPFQGFWADESFFNVFSFEVVAGNPLLALKEPYSLVLTETSAKKLFSETNVTGRQVQVDTLNYTVTAVIKDVPLNSHIRFEALGSFSTIDNHKIATGDKDWMKWDNMWATYLYVLLKEGQNPEDVQAGLNGISGAGNKMLVNRTIEFRMLPLNEIVFSNNMSNSIGPTVGKDFLITLAAFAAVVLISACFNYTNLSIARALRRTREVGVRKVVGATRRQVFGQFLFESIVISCLSLSLGLLIFFLVKPHVIAMNQSFVETLTLRPTWETYVYFVLLAVALGLLAGFLPARFFSKINTADILKNASVTLFSRINLRKALIVFQYTLSLLFIVVAGIGYNQYRYALAFDLGFDTQNILTVELHNNKPAVAEKVFSEIPEVTEVAMSGHVSSVGTSYSGNMKYEDSSDSTILYYNYIDDSYLSLFQHQLLAGRTFQKAGAEDVPESEIIINERALRWMKVAAPHQALGEELIVDGKKLRVIGVVKDFNHNRINYPIENFAFRHSPRHFQVVNLKIQSDDVVATMAKVHAAWSVIDKVHPPTAQFYHEHIQKAYDKLEGILKIIGSIAFLAISIASFGMLGMVVFTTETRQREISVRKIMGASVPDLILLMSRGFIVLLLISSAIATPIAYAFFDKVVMAGVPYRAPIGILDLMAGTMAVMAIAFAMIGSQTFKVARTNPAVVLRTE